MNMRSEFLATVGDVLRPALERVQLSTRSLSIPELSPTEPEDVFPPMPPRCFRDPSGSWMRRRGAICEAWPVLRLDRLARLSVARRSTRASERAQLNP